MESNIEPFSDTFNYYSLTYNYSRYPFGGPTAGSSIKHGVLPLHGGHLQCYVELESFLSKVHLWKYSMNLSRLQRLVILQFQACPNDLCIARAKRGPYRDNYGVLITLSMYKPSHYHAHVFGPSFMPHSWVFQCLWVVDPGPQVCNLDANRTMGTVVYVLFLVLSFSA